MHAPTFRPARIPVIVLLSVLLLVSVTACVSGSDDSSDADSVEAQATMIPRDSGGTMSEPSDDVEAEAPSDAGAAEFDGVAAYDTTYISSQIPLDRLIIRTVTLDLVVEDVGQGVVWVRDLAARKDGFVFSSNTYQQNESQFAQITIRVPAEQLDSTIQELREHDLVLRVDREESTSKDVSQEYVDNEARLEALEETQRRFLALLSEADEVEEILRIESELTNIRSQIETIKGRQNYLDQMTAMSTVTITLSVDGPGVQELDEDEDENFIARIFGDAWDSASGVIEGMLTGTVTAAIIGLTAFPFVLVLYFIGRFAYRRAQVAFFEPRPVATHSVPEEQR